MKKNKKRIIKPPSGIYLFTSKELKLFKETDLMYKSMLNESDVNWAELCKFRELLEELGIRNIDDATPDQLNKLDKIMQKRKNR